MPGAASLRIAHINDIAHVASVLAEAQRRAGMDAVVYDPPKFGGKFPYPFKVLTVLFRIGPLLRLIWTLRRGAFDVVHVHYATHGLLGVLVGVPFIVHCHGTDVRYVRRGTAKGRYLAWVMRRASAVLCSTPDLTTWVEPLRADAQFIPNPIDVEQFRPGQAPADRDVFLGVRLDPIKGAETAIAALALLLDRRPGTTATVVDDGPLAAEAAQRLGQRVEMAPRRDHDEMPALLVRHRLAIGQFLVGAIGQFELEAMACGVPVVADFQYPGAYASPPPLLYARSASAAEELLEETLGDAAALETLAIRSRAWVTTHHRPEAAASRILQVYKQALGEART